MKKSKKRARLGSVLLMLTLYTVSVLSAVVLTVNATDLNAAGAKKGAYVLVADNDSIGCKMYARMINGIVVDDYYIEFYNDGVLTNVSKSAYTITDADVMVVESQIEQMENSQAMMQNSAQSVQSEYLIRCIDGVWRLVECRSMTADGCDCCTQYAYYDALTGEEVA